MDELRNAWLKLKARVEDLATERQQYMTFFERADDAYVVTDGDGTIVAANGAAVDLFARRRSHLKGKPLAVLVAPEARREFRQLGLAPAARWQGCIESRGHRRIVEFSGRAMPGRGACWLVRPLQ